MTLFFLLCKCISICRLRPALSNFICCQILVAAVKKNAPYYTYLYTYICTYICTYLCTLGIVKFDFLVICCQEHFIAFYSLLKDFYRPKQKKRAFYRSLISLASPTNGPTPVFSSIYTYLRTSLLGGLPTAPPFTLFFVSFRSRNIGLSTAPFCTIAPTARFSEFFRLSATSFRNFFWKVFSTSIGGGTFFVGNAPNHPQFFFAFAFYIYKKYILPLFI